MSRVDRSLPEVLTVKEVARELRCSKGHIFNAIAGRLRNVTRLPAIRMGRRKLIRRRTLEQWIEANELGSPRRATLSGEPGADSVCARKEDFHA
jgi:excisionase family DNA binding protein